MAQWLVVGISGVSSSGKTTLAAKLFQYFKQNENQCLFTKNYIINEVVVISQDDYFLPITDSRHQIVPELNSINFEILTALDMDKMFLDIGVILKDEKYVYKYHQKNIETNLSSPSFSDCQNHIKKLNILLIEGFLIYNHNQLVEIFNVKFFIHLPYEKAYERRLVRTYDPPDVVGYFEICVWPWYEKHYKEIKDRKDLCMLNGDISKDRLFKFALNVINEIL